MEQKAQVEVVGVCDNRHEHLVSEEAIIADYVKWWRVVCPECGVKFSVPKKG